MTTDGNHRGHRDTEDTEDFSVKTGYSLYSGLQHVLVEVEKQTATQSGDSQVSQHLGDEYRFHVASKQVLE